MYNLAEAEADMEADEAAGLRNEDGHLVVNTVVSKSKSSTLNKTRSSNFFQKMFSAKEMDKNLNGEEEEEIKTDGDKLESLENAIKTTVANDDTQSVDSLMMEINAKNAAILASKKYPPLPHLGTPINFQRLVNRNHTAEVGMLGLMEMVNNDVLEAIQRAKKVPIQNDLDRVTVTTEISQYMTAVKSRKGLEKRLNNNTVDIQKALAYRKSALIVMNSNYSNKLVRKIDPIYAQEARTIIKPKDN